MSVIVRLKLENGVFIPLEPVPMLEDGDILEFRVPDLGLVFLCETDRLAALDRGQVILVTDEETRGTDRTDG
jgi:predicted DNA-binding antitoxin AbrB/MazE fold protein